MVVTGNRRKRILLDNIPLKQYARSHWQKGGKRILLDNIPLKPSLPFFVLYPVRESY